MEALIELSRRLGGISRRAHSESNKGGPSIVVSLRKPVNMGPIATEAGGDDILGGAHVEHCRKSLWNERGYADEAVADARSTPDLHGVARHT